MNSLPDGALFSIVQSHQHLLKGCYGCKLLWINPDRETHFLTSDDFWTFCNALYLLNQKRLSASELAHHDIHFSSTFCPTCMQKIYGDKYRQKQVQEGNFPCYGSACNGNCDRTDCKYRSGCITHVDWDPSQESYYMYVFHLIEPHIQPSQCAH